MRSCNFLHSTCQWLFILLAAKSKTLIMTLYNLVPGDFSNLTAFSFPPLLTLFSTLAFLLGLGILKAFLPQGWNSPFPWVSPWLSPEVHSGLGESITSSEGSPWQPHLQQEPCSPLKFLYFSSLHFSPPAITCCQYLFAC